jgi:hypothetical protein
MVGDTEHPSGTSGTNSARDEQFGTDPCTELWFGQLPLDNLIEVKAFYIRIYLDPERQMVRKLIGEFLF